MSFHNWNTGNTYANLKQQKSMGPLAGLGITAGIDAIGNFFGNRSRKRESRRQRQFDLDMWNRQNAYNTPRMQMQRLKEAGLNPALMYGQGNTGNANNSVKASIPELANPISSSGVASGIQLSLANSQKELLKANAMSKTLDAFLKTGGSKQSATKYFQQNLENLAADTRQKKEATSKLIAEKAGILIDNHIKDKTKAEVIKRILQETTNMIIDGDIKNEQKLHAKWKTELNKAGLNDSDNVIFRLLIKAGKQFNLNDLFERAVKFTSDTLFN